MQGSASANVEPDKPVDRYMLDDMNDGDRIQKKLGLRCSWRESGTGFAQMEEPEEPATGGYCYRALMLDDLEGLDESTASFLLF